MLPIALLKIMKNKSIKKSGRKNENGEKIIIIKTNSDSEEGRLVANTIDEIKTKIQTDNSDFAILYRTNAQSRAIEESLRRKNINYKIYRNSHFIKEKKLKTFLHILD